MKLDGERSSERRKGSATVQQSSGANAVGDNGDQPVSSGWTGIDAPNPRLKGCP